EVDGEGDVRLLHRGAEHPDPEPVQGRVERIGGVAGEVQDVGRSRLPGTEQVGLQVVPVHHHLDLGTGGQGTAGSDAEVVAPGQVEAQLGVDHLALGR